MPKPRVLFVDDDSSLLNGLRRALKSHAQGWEMTFFDDPKAALAAHVDSPFDAVVSDVSMPGMTGLDLVRAMQSVAPESIYILLTGTADLETAVKTINTTNVFRFFTKPTAAEMVAEGISEGLAERDKKKSPHAHQPTVLPADVGRAALNRLPVGIVAVDARARMLFANRSGAELLSRKDGLIVGADGVCRARKPAETARLHDAVAAALRKKADADVDSAIALSRAEDVRPLTAIVVPLDIALGTEAVAAIFLADHDTLSLPSPEAIGQLFGFTQSEARLAHALALGPDLEAAAERCGLTTSSARTYLKQIFVKAGVERQADLLRLILTTPTTV